MDKVIIKRKLYKYYDAINLANGMLEEMYRKIDHRIKYEGKWILGASAYNMLCSSTTAITHDKDGVIRLLGFKVYVKPSASDPDTIALEFSPERLIFDDFLVEKGRFDIPKRQSITITNIIFNDPATIVFWADGTKTVVKCGEGEKFDKEKGLAMAFTKKVLGNKGSYYNTFKKYIKEDK